MVKSIANFKTALFIVCCMCSSKVAIGQISLRACVVDTDTKLAIPYPTIVSTLSGKGFVANEHGCFEIKVVPSDTLEIRCLGYDRLRLPASELSQDAIIYLVPKIFDLSEVIIISPRNRWTPFQGKPYNCIVNRYCGLQLNAVGIEYVSLVRFSNDDLKELQRVRIRMNYVKPLKPCRLVLYEMCVSGQPGNTLLRQPILIEPKHIRRRGREIEIDLSQYRITVEGQEIFVGIECLPFQEQKDMSMMAQLTHVETDRILTYLRISYIDELMWAPFVHGIDDNPDLKPSLLISVEY
ncbi:MAG: carboxypeptidase-like regulatory domain-containing protein [Bacteroidales bacterium]|jgi:hypothetical protein|nr:carboxypeptidase-like regulatory domain-containing protein [Bacteroidales bacterium]